MVIVKLITKEQGHYGHDLESLSQVTSVKNYLKNLGKSFQEKPSMMSMLFGNRNSTFYVTLGIII